MSDRKELKPDAGQVKKSEKAEETDYEDPICVCEAEPRWEELRRELEEDGDGPGKDRG